MNASGMYGDVPAESTLVAISSSCGESSERSTLSIGREGRGEAGAERRARAKRLRVEGEELVQHRRAGARVAEHEKRPRVDRLPRDRATVKRDLDQAEARVDRREQREERHALPVRRPVDVPPARPQELEPREQADARDGVVLELPPVLGAEGRRRSGRLRHRLRS
eukprot:2906611-Prymnesium_polylepis.1